MYLNIQVIYQQKLTQFNRKVLIFQTIKEYGNATTVSDLQSRYGIIKSGERRREQLRQYNIFGPLDKNIFL